MPLYKFDDFIFDSSNYYLSCEDKEVSLRPKALLLMGLLIENRHRVVSKSEIISAVWESPHVRDYQLFQLVGELRKLPIDCHFVRTQPNLGYQWNIETRTETRTKIRVKTRAFGNLFAAPRLIAASLILGLICSTALVTLSAPEDDTLAVARLPALNALSKGIVALENGETIQAVEWLEFALMENPESVEPALLIAESLLVQGKADESAEYLQTLLQRPDLSEFNRMAVTDLISRAYEQQGRFPDALGYALESSQAEVIAQCSIEVIDERVQLLAGVVTENIATQSGSFDSQPDTQSPQTTFSTNYLERCEELTEENENPSACLPSSFEEFYAHLGYLAEKPIS